MTKVTKELLQTLDACKDQVELFAKVFPEGAEVTPDSLKKLER